MAQAATTNQSTGISSSKIKAFAIRSIPFRRSRLSVIGLILVGLVAFLTFALTRRGYFLADDFVALNQLSLKQTSFTDNLVWFTRDWGIGANFYRPLVRLGYYFQYQFFGGSAVGWHLTSVTLHAFNSMLVYWLAYLLSRRNAVGVVAGVFFATLPIHSEPVAWISGQTDLWATFFCLASVGCFIQMHLSQRRTRRWLKRWLKPWLPLQVLSIFFFVLALLSKESALTLPLVLLAYDFVVSGINHVLPGEYKEPENPDRQPQGGDFSRLLLNHTPFWIVLGFYLVLRLVLFNGLGGYIAEPGQHINLVLFLRSNLRWLLLPFSLSSSDGLTLILVLAAFLVVTGVQEWEVFRHSQALFSEPQPLAVTPSGLRHGKANQIPVSSTPIPAFDTVRTVAYGFIWTIVFLIPAALVQPAERFTYLPSVGFALFLGASMAPFLALSRGLGRFLELIVWLRVAAIVAVLAIYLTTTGGRVQKWLDAGAAARQLLQNTQAVITKPNMPHYSYLYSQNVPDDADGAYLFRTGYPDAIQWLYHDSTLTAFKVTKFPIVEDHLGQSIFLEYRKGNVINHYKIQEALQERYNNLKKQQPYQTWDFSSESDLGLNAGWFVANGTGPVQTKDGNLQLMAPGGITLQNSSLNVPAFELGAIEITLKADPSLSRDVQVTWQATLADTPGKPPQTEPSNFTLIADGSYHTYRVIPQLVPHNNGGLLSDNLQVQDSIISLRLEFPPGFDNLQIQKIVQYRIPSSHSIPID